MEIYVGHSRGFDFRKELYKPIRESSLNDKHTFVLPHENSEELFNSKRYLRKECDLFIADVSEPKIGLGIELGWADSYGVPIACIHKKGSKLSGSSRAVSDNFLEYSNSEELILGIEKIIDSIQIKNLKI